MVEAPKVGMISESVRHLRDIETIWRHEGLKHFVEMGLHASGGSAVGEFILSQLADVQPLDSRLETSVGDLAFQRPVGVGPGYDKKGTMARAWEVLGAGHVTGGGYTFDAQWGKPMPRLRTFDEHVGDHGTSKSLNSYGFPNPNPKIGRKNIEGQRENGATIPIIGQVTVSQAIFDSGRFEEIPDILAATAHELLPVVDAINIGLSSPNIEGMRANQHEDTYIAIVERIQDMMAAAGLTKPIILKGDGDGGEQRNDMYCAVQTATGVILELINTTGLARIKAKYGAQDLPGGLAGADPDYQQLALETVKYIYEQTGAPIIGMGGINSAQQAMKMLGAGASALSVFSAIPDQGLGVVSKIERGISKILDEQYPNVISLDQIIGKDSKRGPKLQVA